MAPTPKGLDDCHALVDYAGTGRRLVTTLKFGNRRSALPWIGAALAAIVDEPMCELVTWAPTTVARAKRRGFDQARLIARSVAVEIELPVRRLLVRVGETHQTGRSRRERMDGPLFRSGRVPVQSVIVVDDVVTTGGSMTAAAAALRSAGADRVVGLALARTAPNSQGGVDHDRRQF